MPSLISLDRTCHLKREALAAQLVLEDGTAFSGYHAAYPKSARGEVVFNTGMVGYVEALTDPSYSGQILVLTYPMIGNYGVPARLEENVGRSFESSKIHVAGLVVSELTDRYSHASAQSSLPRWLQEQGIPCVAGIDTRALTKRLRQHGSMMGRMVCDDDDGLRIDACDELNAVPKVSVNERVVYPGGKRTVLVVDCGCKASIIESLRACHLTVIRVPWDYDFLSEDFDAVVVSNGPGDPTFCHATTRNIERAMQLNRPILGICLGHQLLALAAGAKTYKLKFGHRGHNQPCLELGTGRCFITAQNHGYAVDAASLPDGWEPWFTNANDGSNEGMRHRSRPFMSLQFHPEAAPGPVDCAPLFDKFVSMMP